MAFNIATNRNGSLIPSRDSFFGPFEELFNECFDNVLEGFSGLKSQKVGFPRIDISVEDGKLLVEADVPGYNVEDLTVEILPDPDTKYCLKTSEPNQRYLKIAGSIAHNDASKGRQYYVRELKRSSFERVIKLPEYVRGDPEASMKSGRLKLVWDVPELKAPEKKNIQIKNLDK